MHYGKIVIACLAIAIAAFLLMLMGCASQATVLRADGFNQQWQGFRSLSSEPFGIHEAEIRVKVIVVEDRGQMPIAGAVGSYSHPQGVVHVLGKKINGKILLPEAVTGHEFIHALQFQSLDGSFANPDEYWKFER